MALAPKLFRTIAAFRAWLTAHHRSRTELIVACCKVAHAARGVTYRQALDEALCFGWIDGVRRPIDAATFSVRFTPRKLASAWSRINIRRYTQLEVEGRVHPAGAAAFARRTTPAYSYESRPGTLSAAFQKRLRADARAWRFFQTQPPWYRRTCAFWVMSAKQPETRERRLAVLMKHARGTSPIPMLDRTGSAARATRR